MMQQIFEGLKLEERVAQDLATYWKVAGNTIGIIDSFGYLTTNKGTWKRPMARRSFIALKDALSNNPQTKGIVVGENTIAIDFGCLSYDLEWVKNLICSENLGVCDSSEGLQLFKKKERGSWYSSFGWTLKGVTIEMLNFPMNSKVVDLSQHQDNPDHAEWDILYFAA